DVVARDLANLLFIQGSRGLCQVAFNLFEGARTIWGVSRLQSVQELRCGRFVCMRRIELGGLNFGSWIGALANIGLQILGAILRFAKFNIADGADGDAAVI